MNGQLQSHERPDVLEHDGPGVAAMVLLAGGLQPSPLMKATGQSPLDMPISPGTSVFDLWVQHAERLFQQTGRNCRLDVVYTPNLPVPRTTPGHTGIEVNVLCDDGELRGPAGAVRDLCKRLAPDALVLIAEACRYVWCDLTEILAHHVQKAADITVACNESTEPAGIYLASRKMLDLISEEGFVDIKEQWLSRALTEGRAVHVCRLKTGGCELLRTRRQFLDAARHAVGDRDRRRASRRFAITHSVQSETFALVEDDATIEDDAIVIDSIVLSGAVIRSGATVVRSIIGQGIEVPGGAEVVEKVLATNEMVGGVADNNSVAHESSST